MQSVQVFALHIEIIYIAKNPHLSVLYTIFFCNFNVEFVKTVTVRSIHSNTLRDAQKSCIRMIWRSMKTDRQPPRSVHSDSV